MRGNSAAATRLMRLAEVVERTGRTKSPLYRDIAAGAFPAPVHIGPRAARWVESEVDAWIAARIAERDADPSDKRPGYPATAR